jgi:hypothetical protein
MLDKYQSSRHNLIRTHNRYFKFTLAATFLPIATIILRKLSETNTLMKTYFLSYASLLKLKSFIIKYEYMPKIRFELIT